MAAKEVALAKLAATNEARARHYAKLRTIGALLRTQSTRMDQHEKPTGIERRDPTTNMTGAAVVFLAA
jgi:hypothetical protein